LDVIRQTKQVPGVSELDLETHRAQIEEDWKQLIQHGFIAVENGSDEVYRARYVALQAIVEHVLAKKLLGVVIHTPNPATPLCTKGEISFGLVNETVAASSELSKTISARAVTVREILFQGCHVDVVYPKNGRDGRTQEQLDIYVHLHDHPLTCDGIPEPLVGAYYRFKNNAGDNYGFAIKITQANTATKSGNYGLWLAPMTAEAISTRIEEVSKFITEHTAK
jgi:hypothetical protein